jgi:hypothetical protein
MNTERVVRIFAGLVILLSVGLGASGSPIFHSVHWLWLTAFVGLNLFQSAFTGWCPMITFLRKLGVPDAPLARSH